MELPPLSITISELRKKLRSELWPAGEARSHRPSHDASFIACLFDLQKWDECLQQNNTSQFRFCATYFQCGLTVIDAPVGRIKRVYTIANDEWCDPVFYRQREFQELLCWANQIVQFTSPGNTGLPKLPMGLKFAESSTDSTCGRARLGLWARHRHRIYIAPWIQSNETVVVEWDGPKPKWEDTDVLDQRLWTPEVEEAIKYYMLWKEEVFFGDNPQLKVDAGSNYANKLADIIWECKENTKLRLEEGCAYFTGPTSDQIKDDTVPPGETYSVGVIGDYGQAGANENDVAAALAAKAPKRLITVGDNTYDADITANILTPFQSWIDQASAINTRFFPAWGNHDWDQNNLADLLGAFTLPNNERYYSMVYGPAQFFFLDSDPREPDSGYIDAVTSTANGIMGKWLAALLAVSTATWKIVVCHHPPFSSDDTHGSSAWMNWGFAGADLVLSGHAHDYERLSVGGKPYIVNGVGGVSLRGFAAPVAGSQFRYNADYGFGLITFDCNQLKYEQWTRGLVLVDSLQLTK